MAEIIIELHEVSKHFTRKKIRVRALAGINFNIRKGDFIALQGRPGSGKRTLLNIIGLLDGPTTGALYFKDKNSIDLDSSARAELRRGRIGYVFSCFNLVPLFSVYENIEVPLMIGKVDPKLRKDRVNRVLRATGLFDLAGFRPAELDKWQQQRTVIARALVTNPDLIIAYEPSTILSSEEEGKSIALMKSINNKIGTAIVYSSHDPDLIRQADITINLRNGSIAAD